MKKIIATIFTACAFMSAQAQSNLSPEVNAYLESYKTTAKTRSAEASHGDRYRNHSSRHTQVPDPVTIANLSRHR